VSGREQAGRPRERHDGFTGARKKAFLEALGKYGTIADACRVAGVSRRTFYYHRDRWADFAAACEGQLARAAGAIETLAWERATVGAEEVVIRGGEVVQVRRKPSDAMLRLLLQASDPAKYGRMAEVRRAEIEGQVRAEIAAEAAQSTEGLFDELAARLAAMQAEESAEDSGVAGEAEPGEG
jgi:AcrR family transcriptional regulator